MGAGSCLRINVPIYCICRCRAPCFLSDLATVTASSRSTGKSMLLSCSDDNVTSCFPSANKDRAAFFFCVLLTCSIHQTP